MADAPRRPCNSSGMFHKLGVLPVFFNSCYFHLRMNSLGDKVFKKDLLKSHKIGLNQSQERDCKDVFKKKWIYTVKFHVGIPYPKAP